MVSPHIFMNIQTAFCKTVDIYIVHCTVDIYMRDMSAYI